MATSSPTPSAIAPVLGPAQESEARPSPYRLALIASFLVTLVLPLVTMALHADPAPPRGENRTMAPFPALSGDVHALLQFPQQFKHYFDDHFGFRSSMIRWFGIIKVNWLHVPSNTNVILGKDGWLFQAGEGSLAGFQRTDPLTPAQLLAWQRLLEGRAEYLHAHGIRFLTVIAPNKDSIYPEYMPDPIGRAPGPSRLDQLLAHLQAHSHVHIVDLREALLAAKASYRVYHRTDTHWNDRGAFVAYGSIVAELRRWFPQIHALRESDFDVVIEQAAFGDLAGQLGLNDFYTETRPVFRPRIALVRPHTDPATALITAEQSDASLPRAVVFRDSFSTYLIPWLSSAFSRVVYAWNMDEPRSIDYDLIRREHPDVVVNILVERRILGDPPAESDVLAPRSAP